METFFVEFWELISNNWSASIIFWGKYWYVLTIASLVVIFLIVSSSRVAYLTGRAVAKRQVEQLLKDKKGNSNE